MVFGRETALPLDTLYARANEVPRCTAAYTQWLETSLRSVYDIARRHLDAKLHVQKRYFDRRINRRDFNIGNSVIWLRPHRNKLQNVWQGPYKIVKKSSEWHHYTIEREGKRRKVTAWGWWVGGIATGCV
jgi:hypothetical protein